MASEFECLPVDSVKDSGVGLLALTVSELDGSPPFYFETQYICGREQEITS